MDNDDMTEAYNALQQAVYWAGRSPSIWITVGILYFRVRQYHNCHDALYRSVILNRTIWQAWYNMGVLVRTSPSALSPLTQLAFTQIITIYTRTNDCPSFSSTHITDSTSIHGTHFGNAWS